MEYLWKIIEVLGSAFMTIISLILLLVAIFGGKINIEINGIEKIIKMFTGE